MFSQVYYLIFIVFLKGYVEHVNMKSKSPGKVRLVVHNLVGCL